MISTSKMGAVVVGGHSTVQRSGHLPVRQLESLAADIVESDISIPFAGDYLDAFETESERKKHIDCVKREGRY